MRVETYLARLSAELGRVGIRGRLRRRILAETADHLAEGDQDLFGDPPELARQFADELSSDGARRSAIRSFGALALAGGAYAVVGVSLGRPDVAGASQPLLGILAAFGLILLPQVSFVSGSLAGLRAWRRRDAPVLPAGEIRLVLRRAGIGLAAGAGSLVCAALYAFEFRTDLGAAWSDAALVSAGVASIPLAAVTVTLVRVARLRPSTAGAAGDVFDDLGPFVAARYRDRPWAFAALVATTVGAVVLLAGVVQGDPFDAALRGIAEALACLGGFWAFGKPLGLRR